MIFVELILKGIVNLEDKIYDGEIKYNEKEILQKIKDKDKKFKNKRYYTVNSRSKSILPDYSNLLNK